MIYLIAISFFPLGHFFIPFSQLKLIKWNSYENNELDGESHDSYISDDTSASDFDFDYNELELSDEDLDVRAEELSLTNESNVADSGFTLISLIE